MPHAAVLPLLLVASYLLGSTPFGLWIAWKLKGVDIRKMGSGNIGATNVGRICGPRAYALVFALDVLKGLLPPLAAARLNFSSAWQVTGALLAIVGHNYSIWLGFKGGKGIAASLGALIGISPWVALGAFLAFGVEFVALRYVSLGSLAAAVSLPILMPVFYPGDHSRFAFATLACIMAVYKHRGNIARLRVGTEPRVSLRRKAPGEPPVASKQQP
jgi:glycerol-3-phosphate acyltransferase PlsY